MPDQAPPILRPWRTTLWAVAIFTVATLPFLPALANGFINCDDDQYVTANPHVAGGLTAAGVRWAFTAFHSSNWHPLTWLSHMLDVQLFGLKPAGHHATSIALHALTAVVLFLLLARLTRRTTPAAVVALLFAVHPLRVESVAWAAERKDVLSGLLGLTTLWLYARYVAAPGAVRYTLALAAFALGLMAKPMLVTIPALMLLMDFWPLRRLRGSSPLSLREGAGVRGSAASDQRTDGRHGLAAIDRPVHESRSSHWSADYRRPVAPFVRLLLEKLPFFALAAASCVVTLIAQSRGGSVVAIQKHGLLTRLATAVCGYGWYLEKLFVPRNLAILYPGAASPPPGRLIGGALVLIAVTGLALQQRRRRAYLLFGWLWYLVTLAPVIGIVQVGQQAVADRYSYLPLIGPVIALVWAARDVVRRLSVTRAAHANGTNVPSLAGAVTGAAVLALAALTMSQTKLWKDSITVFDHSYRVAGPSHLTNNNLAAALMDAGAPELAIPLLEEAAQRWTKDSDSWVNLGGAELALGHGEAAVAALRRACALSPRDVKVFTHLATACAQLQRPADAEWSLRRAIELSPRDAALRNNLGIALAQQGRLPDAADCFRAALAIDPAHESARANLARADRLAAE